MHSRAGSLSASVSSQPNGVSSSASASSSSSSASASSVAPSHAITMNGISGASSSLGPGLPTSIYDEKHHHPSHLTPSSPKSSSRVSTPLRSSTRERDREKEKDRERDRDRDRHGEKGLTPTINLALPVFWNGRSSSTWGNGGIESGRIGLGIGSGGPPGGGGGGFGAMVGSAWSSGWLRPRLVIALSAALIFYLGYITGAGSPTPSRSTSYTPASASRFSFRSKQKIPFLLRPELLPPPADPPEFAITPDRKIPPYVHYVFGLSPDFGGKPFGFIQYAAIQSALQILHPKKIFFHYLYEPEGWWWDRVREVEGFTPVKTRDVKEVFGRPIEHFAHKADVIRLEALRDHGGIYLDTDVFIVRNFDPLLSSDVVMAEEAQPSLRPTDPPSGLCNAVILARPYAPFVMRWIESYRSFDKGLWATHSVAKPWDLARMHPNEITVLDRHAFFFPLWHEDHVDLVHNTMNWDFDRSGQYLYHAWESLTWNPHLQKLDPDRIHVWGEGETSFTRFVRRYVHEDIRNKWRDAHARGEV